MPQPRRDAVHRFYIYEDNYSKCSLCDNKLKGKHTTNLKNHLAVKHVDTYNEVLRLNKEYNPPKDKNSKNDNIIIELKKICMQLVAVCGRPLALLNDKPFQNLLMLAAPSNLRIREINEKSVRAMIPEVAYNIKLKIATEIRHKMVSLKIDSATCLDRRFVGVNIQYIKNGLIVVRNLAVTEVNESQTGEFLKEKLLEIINDCRILKHQIYSITTDNGANMKKMIKLMGGIITNDDIDESEDEGEDEVMNHEEPNDIMEEQLLIITNMLNTSENENDFKIRGMLCAAHTLQLVVKDAIAENIEAQTTLNMARRISKSLRTPTNRNLLKMSNLKIPIVDCATRWTSSYNMLSRLCDLKEFCENIVEVSELITPIFWSEINYLLNCLEPFNKSTLILQREQLTIGDFFINWMECKLKVGCIRHPFATSLQKAMESREKSLLETDVILEGLYLDGRLNIVLSEDQCQKAKVLLKQTWKILKNTSDMSNQELEENFDQPGPSNRLSDDLTISDDLSMNNDLSLSMSDDLSMSNDLSIIEQMLVRTEVARNLPTTSITSFDAVVHELRNLPRLSLSTNIIQYWHNKSVTNADIAMVANTVLATPVTQVSVERMFSTLKFLFSPLRSNLNSNLLRDMLFIRSNQDLLD